MKLCPRSVPSAPELAPVTLPGLLVDVGDTAAALGSGDANTLGTPRVLALWPRPWRPGSAISTPTSHHGHPGRGRPLAAFPPWRSRAGAAALRSGRRFVLHVAVNEPDGRVASAVIVRAVLRRATFGG